MGGTIMNFKKLLSFKITCKYKNCTNKFLPKTAGDKYCSIGCEKRDKSPCNLV